MPPDSGNAAVNWQSFLNQIIQGGIDVARLKHLGVPTADTRVPDQADLYYGNTAATKAAGIPPAVLWMLIGVAIIGGGLVLYRIVK